MIKALTNKGNEEKKAIITETLEKKFEKRTDVTLKQNSERDFDLQFGSVSIVRIVAGKKDNTNGVALFRVCKDSLQDISKITAVNKDGDNESARYNIDECGRVETCFYRFNYETIQRAIASALAIFDLMEKAITKKKAEAEAKKKEASKEDSKKAEAKTDSKKEDKKAEAKKADKKKAEASKEKAKRQTASKGSKKAEAKKA